MIPRDRNIIFMVIKNLFSHKPGSKIFPDNFDYFILIIRMLCTYQILDRNIFSVFIVLFLLYILCAGKKGHKNTIVTCQLFLRIFTQKYVVCTGQWYTSFRSENRRCNAAQILTVYVYHVLTSTTTAAVHNLTSQSFCRPFPASYYFFSR